MSRYEDELAELDRRRSEHEFDRAQEMFDNKLRESIVIKRLIARIEVLEGGTP